MKTKKIKHETKSAINGQFFQLSKWYPESAENDVLKKIVSVLSENGLYMDGLHCRETYSIEMCEKRQVWPLIDENDNEYNASLILSRYWGSNNGHVEIFVHVA